MKEIKGPCAVLAIIWAERPAEVALLHLGLMCGPALGWSVACGDGLRNKPKMGLTWTQNKWASGPKREAVIKRKKNKIKIK